MGGSVMKPSQHIWNKKDNKCLASLYYWPSYT